MFEELVKTLILGSSNMEQIPASLFDELRDLGYKFNPDKDKTEQLLEALAIYAPLVKGTALLPKLAETDLLEKHREESLECCPREVVEIFVKVKKRDEIPLFQEFFILLIENNWRINEESLPDVLDLGIKQKEFRKSIAQIVGERGKWLVGFNPEWNYVLNYHLSDDFDFMTASRPHRVYHLSKIREENSESAIQLLTEIWKNEDAQSKLEFLKLLESSLNVQDTALLEMALEDGRKEVRNEAIRLLSKLPEAKIVLAYQNYLNNHVSFDSSEGVLNIEIIFFKSDENLEKFGLNSKQTFIQDSKEANLLAQIVAAVPTSYWSAQRELNYKSFLEAAYQHKHKNAWFWGIATSLKTFPNEEMMTELHRFLFKQNESLSLSLDMAVFAEGPYDELFNKISLAYLNREKNLKQPLLNVLLRKLRPWNSALSAKIAGILLELAEQNAIFEKYWVEMLYFASYNMETGQLSTFYEQWKKLGSSAWDAQIKIFFEVLELRNELKKLKKNQ